MDSTHNMQVEVRGAGVADGPRMAALFIQLGYPDAGDGLAQRLLQQLSDPGTDVLVAVDGATLVGVLVMHTMAPLHVARPWALISALVVDQQCRSLGAGAALIARAGQAAAARHCGHLELSCSEQRTRAHAFYTGLGFIEVRRRFKKILPE